MLYIFQAAVIIAFGFSDIRWGWADNQLLSGFIGAVVASFLTLWWAKWQDRKYKPDTIQLPAHIEQMLDDGIQTKLIEDKPVFKKWGVLYVLVPMGMLVLMVTYTEYFMD